MSGVARGSVKGGGFRHLLLLVKDGQHLVVLHQDQVGVAGQVEDVSDGSSAGHPGLGQLDRLLPGELGVLAGLQLVLHDPVVAVGHQAGRAVRADRQGGDRGGVTVARESADQADGVPKTRSSTQVEPWTVAS